MRTLLAPCLLATLLFTGCRSTPPAVVGDLHPVAQMASDQLGPEGGAFGLLVTFEVADGAVDEFERLFLPAIAATWTEPGNDDYELARVGGSPGTYVLYERWRSVADLDWHLKSEPIVTLLEGTADITEVDVKVLTRLVRP